MGTHETKRDELLIELARSDELTATLRGRSAEFGDLVDGPLAAAADELYVIDVGGTIVDVNVRALQRLGYERDELLGRPLWSISARQNRAAFEKLVSAVVDDGPQCLFGHNRRKDGSTYSVEARLWLAPFVGAGGQKEAHVFAVVRDAHGSQGLIEERDQLISLIENSAEAIAVATPEGVCSYINPAGLTMTGSPNIDDVVGLSLAELLHDEQQDTVENEVVPAVRRGRWQGELAFRRVAGSGETPCWVNAFAIRHSQTGDVIGLAVIAHDISERKAVERQRQRLLELNEVSRNVATSLLEHDDLNRAIGIILEGVGRILNVSRAYLCRYREDRSLVFRTHQWTSDGGEAHVVAPRPEDAGIYTWATDLLLRGEPIHVDDVATSHIVPRDGSGVLRPDVQALIVMPVVINGRLESFFGFVDTTAPRAWEEEELAILEITTESFARAVERRILDRDRASIAADLERAVARERSANRYKTEFLANMSHELRTPMNAIVGYAELLKRPHADDSKRALWVDHIYRSTGYLLSLINDVLDLSKIEAGEMSIAKERCSLPEIIASVKELLAGQAREKLLDFRFEYDGAVPEWIVTDPVRMRQILVNLVSNAIKFTSEGGVLVRVALRDDDGVTVDVTDTGIGIDRENLKRLFRPFTQVHAAGETRFGGTGLGLDISRHLARMLGGEIEVESEVGKGSTFRLVLPLATEDELASCFAAIEEPIPVAGAVDLSGRRILIVDDSRENREVLGFLLGESGCTIECAEDGRAGVEMALSAAKGGKPYDVVLMDMNMPVLDGYGATRQIVEQGIDSPVIALTALALDGDEERCRVAGCVDYVSKPFVPSRFLETVARHLRELPAPDPAAVPPPTAYDDVFESLASNPRFRPLVRRYVQSFETIVPELRSLYADGRIDEVRTRVHRLRGTAANYGYPEISRLAGEVEDAIRTNARARRIRESLERLMQLLLETPVPHVDEEDE